MNMPSTTSDIKSIGNNTNPCINPRNITPTEAIYLTDEEKRVYFDRVRLGHPRIAQTLEKMARLTTPTSGKSIVLLIGPTGVGKSTLVSTLGERLVDSVKDEIERDPSFVPAAKMVVPASGERQFAWKMFYQALGDALDEPLMDKKLETRIKNERVTVWQPGSRSSVVGMRMAVEKAILNRRTQLVVIDEAAPLLRGSAEKLDHHMDALKTLADTGAKLVLVGSYDLHALASLDAQVARRTATAHFSRYLPGNEDDEKAFKTMVGILQLHMPLKDMPDLREWSRELQVACIGCVGILKTVLATALECALANKGKWSDQFLEQALLSEDAYGTILSETILGENRVEKSSIGSGSFNALQAKAEAVAASVRASR